ncbi:unnamed protein product [Lactuca saligna]|uniref:Uncharacterized protein n=1 Tax=Lactuca saligna TaxID=75948 RepID=A0AA35Z801_LACSI|nr:unnamed protein product [Lactuca saligna]
MMTSRHSEISYTRLWSIIVKRAIIHLQIQVPDNCVIAAIPIFHTSKFIVSDPTKFDFVGSILESMTRKVVFGICISDINEYLQRLLETHDSILTISVGQHLFEKLKLVFRLLNQLEGVSRSSVIPKQGGEHVTQEKIQKDPLQLKLKEKSDEHHEMKPKDDQKVEAREKEAHDEQVTLATQKTLFPPWSMERILNEADESPSTHWLELAILFDLENTSESQLDLPITPRRSYSEFLKRLRKL